MIELTPEWVLKNLSDHWFALGEGYAVIAVSDEFSAAWIELALDTLDIEWEVEEHFIDGVIYSQYDFDIEELKEECPEFYEELIEENKNV